MYLLFICMTMFATISLMLYYSSSLSAMSFISRIQPQAFSFIDAFNVTAFSSYPILFNTVLFHLLSKSYSNIAQDLPLLDRVRVLKAACLKV